MKINRSAAAFTCSFGAADESSYEVIGTKGVLKMDPAYEMASDLKGELVIDGKTKNSTYKKRDQFGPEIVYFSNCILQDKQPEPSGLEGLADVRIIEAIYHSIRTRRTVAIPQLIGKEMRPDEKQGIHRPAHGKPEVFHAHSASREAA